MGWTWIHADHFTKTGKVDRKAQMHHEMFSHWDGWECLADAMVGTTYYAAAKKLSTGEVFALVCLTGTDTKDYYNFGYKDMDETCGPTQYKCPIKILNLLTPTESQWANEWRERCHKYHADRTAPNAFKNLPEGTEVIWTVPHDGFTGLNKGDRIKLTKGRLSPGKKGSPYVWHLQGRYYIRPSLVSVDDIS